MDQLTAGDRVRHDRNTALLPSRGYALHRRFGTVFESLYSYQYCDAFNFAGMLVVFCFGSQLVLQAMTPT